jgi:serralysin
VSGDFALPTVGAFSAEIAVFDGIKDKGAFVASGDVNGDGQDDIVIGSALKGNKVKVFNGATGVAVNFTSSGTDFLQPFGDKFKGGIRVATGDVNGDGKEDVVVGMGFKGADVKIFAGNSNLAVLDGIVLQDFTIMNGTKAFKGGVSVATGDLDGDHKADLIIGRNTGKPSQIETFKGTNLAPLDATHGGIIIPFDADPTKLKFKGGVRVAAVDVNGDGIADIIAGAGAKGDSQVKIYNGATHALIRALTAYPDYLKQAIFVAGSSTVPV